MTKIQETIHETQQAISIRRHFHSSELATLSLHTIGTFTFQNPSLIEKAKVFYEDKRSPFF